MNNNDLEKTILEQEPKVTVNQVSINQYMARLYSNEFSNSDDLIKGEEGEPAINRKLITFDRLKENLNNRILGADKTEKGSGYSLFPMNCRLVIPVSSDFTLYVIETAPEIRTVVTIVDQNNYISMLKTTGEWDDYGYTGKEETGGEYNQPPWKFSLAFPYCVYLIVLHRQCSDRYSIFQIYFRNMPLRGLGDMLYKAPLYNIPETQNACLGMGTAREADPILHIEQLMQHFWASSYNGDYIANILLYQNTPIINNYFIWQHISKTNPMEIFGVDWIPHKTLKSQIEYIKDLYKNDRGRNPKLFYTIDDFTSIFSQELLEKSKKADDKEIKFLIDGAANYISLGSYSSNMYTLYSEDSFKIRNKRFFVISFMSDNEHTYDVSHLKVIDENQKTRVIKLTERIKDLITRSIEKDNFILTTSIDGITIRKGDVIKIVTAGGHVRHRKILHMRYNLNGKLEARLGSDSFIMERLKIIGIVNLENPEIYGVLIDKESEYILVHQSRHHYKAAVYNIGKYSETTVSDYGVIEHLFKIVNNDNLRVGEENVNITAESNGRFKLAYKPEELRRLPLFHRHGVRLICYEDDDNNKYPVYSLPNDINLIPRNKKQDSPNIDLILDNFLYNNGESILIEGGDGDLYFSVGDKVIIPDWSNPSEMLRYKTIKSFNTETDISGKKILAVTLENKDGTTFSKTLICRDRGSNFIDLRSMYRITNIYGSLRAGMKIKAKDAKISNFPMKDTNIIIGILIDLGIDGDPLVLCSNGCTLWYDDIIEKFNIIQFGDIKWKKLEHAPLDVSKIKPQAGDFYIKSYDNNFPYFLCYERDHRPLKGVYYQQSEEASEYGSSFITFNADTRKNSIPYGILGPRYTPTQLIEMTMIKGFVSPFLTITENERSKFWFPINEGRANNYVQRLSE